MTAPTQPIPQADVDSLIKGAKEWRDAGFTIVPFMFRFDEKKGKYGKIPAIKGWGLEKKLYSDEEIEHFFKKLKCHGIGIVTGAINGISVIDIDSKEVADKIMEWGIDQPKVMQRTISGGWHGLYMYDKDAPQGQNLNGTGVDVRNDGGFIAAYPSHNYSITCNISEVLEKIKPFPREILKRIGKKTHASSVNKNTEPPISGTFGHTLEQWLNGSVTDDTAFEMLCPRHFKNQYGTWLAPNDIPDGSGNDYMARVKSLLAAEASVSDELAESVLLRLNESWSSPIEERVFRSAYINPIKRDTFMVNGEDIKNSFFKQPDNSYPIVNETAVEENIFEALRERGFFCWYDDALDKFGKRNIATGEVDFKAKGDFIQSSSLELSMEVKKNHIACLPLMRMVFDPLKGEFFKENSVSYINNFHKTQYMEMVGKVDKLPPTIGKVIKNIFKGNPEMLPLFLNWLACMFQTREKSTVCWVFVGSQGSGKGTLYDYVLQPLFRYTTQVTPNILESSFNDWMHEKLLININEGNQDYKSRTMLHNKLKSWITDPTLHVNAKGLKMVERRNTANFIIFTNDKNGLEIEEGDRRFNVIRTGGNLSALEGFNWDEWKAGIESELVNFAMFLNGYKTNRQDYNRCVMTEFKKAMQKASTTNTDLFCTAMRGVDVEFFEEHTDADNDYKIRDAISQMRSGFISNEAISILWEAVTHEKANSIKISRMLGTNEVGKKDRRRIGDKIVRGIILDIKEIEEVF